MHYEYERERITEEMKKTISLHKFNVKGLVVSNFLLERERERERMLLIAAPQLFSSLLLRPLL